MLRRLEPLALLLLTACSTPIEPAHGDGSTTGGRSSLGGTGGATNTGGTSDSGGSASGGTGGQPSSGGAANVGGTAGATNTGGTSSSGGSANEECSDGVKQGSEEGTDCGFVACGTACFSAPSCATETDCTTSTCHEGSCIAPLAGVYASGLHLASTETPYLLREDIQIDGDLVIDPGVTILGNGHGIRANGTVTVSGTSDDRIRLVDVTFDAGSMDPENPTAATFAFVDVFGGGLSVRGADRYGSFSLTDSRVTASGPFIFQDRRGDVTIERNVFLNTQGFALYTTSPFSLAHNYFENITPWDEGTTIVVAYTEESGPVTITHNTFADAGARTVAIKFSAWNVLATNNYWGTTSSSTIEAMIVDKLDKLDLAAEIPYAPFLTAPDPGTPDRNGAL